MELDFPSIVSLQLLSLPGGGFKAECNIPIFTKQKDGVWIAHSPAFGTIGYSTESEAAALADHDRDVEVFLGINLKRGTLQSALSHLGWEFQAGEEGSKFQKSTNIPVHLLKHARVKKSNYEGCYA